MNFIVLGLIDFCVFGIQVTLIGAVPMDFGSGRQQGQQAGLIDFFAYIGTGMVDVFSGVLTDRIGWESAFWY